MNDAHDAPHVPSRALPAAFLLFSLAGIGVVFAVPWMGSGSDVIPTQWNWANEMFPVLGGTAMQPPVVALTGLLLGAAASVAWLALGSLLPEAQWTAAREAAAAALVAPSLMLVGAAGGAGIGYSFVASDGNSWAVSPAGIALVTMAGLGALLLVPALLARLPARRSPVALLAGVIVGCALFQAIPWLTSTRASGVSVGDTTNLVRPMFQAFGIDPLAPLSLALGLLGGLATVWVLAVALVPRLPVRDARIDASFALVSFVPLAFAAVGIGRVLGASLGGYETVFGGGVPGALDDEEATVYAVNAYVFVALLLAALALLATTLLRRSRALELEGSP